MAVSKVVLGDETLIDLTGDSVSSENLLQGETAHGANGEEVIGGVVVTPMYTGTKAAIEEAIALGQIPEDAVVNITDDEETSSFQTQINELNSSLGKYELLFYATSTGNISVQDLTKYKAVLALLQVDNNIYTTLLIPLSLFKTITISRCSYNDISGVYKCDFKYVDDTTINVLSLSNSTRCYFYGI